MDSVEVEGFGEPLEAMRERLGAKGLLEPSRSRPLPPPPPPPAETGLAAIGLGSSPVCFFSLNCWAALRRLPPPGFAPGGFLPGGGPLGAPLPGGAEEGGAIVDLRRGGGPAGGADMFFE